VSSSAGYTREDSTGSSDATKFNESFKINVGVDFLTEFFSAISAKKFIKDGLQWCL